MDDSKQKILVIDDDRGPRESLRMLLKNDYQVACVSNVGEGLERLRENPPDLIIMDIRMPEVDGIEGLRRIREIDPVVSVMMLTGYGALETAQEALRLGACDYQKKPFETDQIRAAIATHVERGVVARRQAESERELRALNQRLLDELDQHEHLASLGQASAELVHDLRNPMTVVYGYVQLLSSDLRKACKPDANQASAAHMLEYLDIVEQSVDRCTDLIEVWQSLGKKDPGRVMPAVIPQLLKEVVQSFSKTTCTRRVTMEMATCGLDNGGCVLGDRVQLSRVFHNLIGNALDAVADDGSGRIEVACRRNDGHVEVTVTDNGHGMPPDVCKRILEAYYTTKQAHKGTGLGLFIAKKIIDDHHGRLDVQSEVGKGSRFTVSFPAWVDNCVPADNDGKPCSR